MTAPQRRTHSSPIEGKPARSAFAMLRELRDTPGLSSSEIETVRAKRTFMRVIRRGRRQVA